MVTETVSATGRDVNQPIWIDAVELAPLHATRTDPVPGCVLLPIFQLHDAAPVESAAIGTRPAAVLLVRPA